MKELQRAVENVAQDLEGLAHNYVEMDAYFDDVIDIEYRICGQGEYRNVCLMVTGGGPTIYVDTKEESVHGYWGDSEWICPLSSDVVRLIDEIFEEYWEDTV